MNKATIYTILSNAQLTEGTPFANVLLVTMNGMINCTNGVIFSADSMWTYITRGGFVGSIEKQDTRMQCAQEFLGWVLNTLQGELNDEMLLDIKIHITVQNLCLKRGCNWWCIRDSIENYLFFDIFRNTPAIEDNLRNTLNGNSVDGVSDPATNWSFCKCSKPTKGRSQYTLNAVSGQLILFVKRSNSKKKKENNYSYYIRRNNYFGFGLWGFCHLSASRRYFSQWDYN
jgi:hypothetical protein